LGFSGYDERAAMSDNLKKNFLAVAWGSERGVALIIVLWIFIFLFAVAFDFSSSVREEANAAHRYNDENQGYYLALAGFQQGLYDFLSQSAGKQLQRDQQPSDLFDGSWREGKLGAASYRVRLMDEGGKINLNRIDENALRRLFTNLGIEEPRRSILVDSIMDWRDPDELHRINGAESDYYRSLSPPYTSKNGPFDTVEELLWVRGVTSSLFFGYAESGATQGDSSRSVGLREIFTVDSPTDRVNLRTASAEIIHAMTGIPLEKARAFVEERKKLSDKTLPDLLSLLGIGASDTAMQGFIFTNPSVVAVQAEGQLIDARAPRRVKGIVRLGGGQQGYELLRWIDRDTGLPSG
jgi:general secretion pathway protein K